jgi:hypothetical protein
MTIVQLIAAHAQNCSSASAFFRAVVSRGVFPVSCQIQNIWKTAERHMFFHMLLSKTNVRFQSSQVLYFSIRGASRTNPLLMNDSQILNYKFRFWSNEWYINPCQGRNQKKTLWITAKYSNYNEEPAMSNLIIDGAAGGETKRRHDVTFPLLTLHRGKDRVHFST